MEKRKISIVTMIIILILALIVGAGIGYFVSQRTNKKIEAVSKIDIQDTNIKQENIVKNKEDKEDTENTEKVENIQPTIVNEIVSDNIIEIVKYDGSKDITIKGNKYTVSYNNKLVNSQSDTEYYNVEIYFNNKKIKTYKNINGQSWKNAIGAEVWKDIEEIEVHSIKGEQNKEYILIVLNTSHASAMIEKHFCVVNTEGEIIGILEWDSATGITLKDGKENTAQRTDLTYEINENNIVIYEACRVNSQGGAVKYKISVNDNYLHRTIERFYTENEVELAGK